MQTLLHLMVLSFFIGEGVSYAALFKATVISADASIAVLQGSRMLPVKTVGRGGVIYVSDVARSGWRQAWIAGSRWGWVPENKIKLDTGGAPVSRAGTTVKRREDLSPARLVLTTKGGYMMPLGSAGGPVLGLELGLFLTHAFSGNLYVTVQGQWARASAVPLGFPDNATYPLLQAGIVVRSLFASGLYAGALAGATLVGVTVGSDSASELQYSMSLPIGYDFRPSRFFSFGPEVSLYDIALGGHTSVLFQGTLRLFF